MPSQSLQFDQSSINNPLKYLHARLERCGKDTEVMNFS
jgi:hypothetical protein